MVWESPAARGAFAAERMVPLFEAGILGEEHGHPERVTPLHVYLGAPHEGSSSSR
jgi:hypothetical protein